MSAGTKNKLLTWLVVLLLLANAATITLFWLNKTKRPPLPKGSPREFLVTELKFDTKQQEQFDVLVKEHRRAAEELRKKTREAKEAFFDLLKQSSIADSVKLKAAKNVSTYTEGLDLLTLNHFQKVRVLCTTEQQKIFDHLIQDVIEMIGRPGKPMRPQGPPPPGERGDDRPPPGE
jgi:hypothetical protein